MVVPLSPARAWAILRARWPLVLGLFALVAGAVMGAALIQPKQYTATATAVVDARPDAVSAPSGTGVALAAFMATQVDIVRSERVAQRAATLLVQERQEAALHEQWRAEQADDPAAGDPAVGLRAAPYERWLAQTLREAVDVRPGRDGGVLAIHASAAGPALAADIANAYLQAYADTVLELRVDPARQFNSFFESRASEARTRLAQAQARLSAFMQAKGIVAVDDKLGPETARLASLNAQLTALQSASADSASRQQQAQGAQADRLQEVLNHPLLAQLRGDIGRSEAQLQLISTRLGDNHPQVLEQRSQLAGLRSRLDSETRRISGGAGVANSINRQREAEVRAAVAAQREVVLRLKAVHDEGLLLQRDVDSAQRADDAVQQRLAQVSLESQSTQGHVHVLSRALPALQATSPRLWLSSLLGVLLGALLAVGSTLLLEWRRARVRCVEDLVQALQIPVLAVIARPALKAN